MPRAPVSLVLRAAGASTPVLVGLSCRAARLTGREIRRRLSEPGRCPQVHRAVGTRESWNTGQHRQSYTSEPVLGRKCAATSGWPRRRQLLVAWRLAYLPGHPCQAPA